MVVVLHAVGIAVVRTGHADLLRFLIHQRNKCIDRTRNMLCNRLARVVAGDKHEPVDQIPQRQRFAWLNAHQRRILGKLGRGAEHFLPDGKRIVEVAVFEGHQRGHNLGRTRGKHFLIRIALKKHHTRVVTIHNNHVRRWNRVVVIVRKRYRGDGKNCQNQQNAEKSFHSSLPIYRVHRLAV
ncbi:hypothetical protein SDC9_175286 [bioreactor metagenome]|uniref:Uncharacterized protein n=1 Tax=bioreactor metagenome TaxID=1076179 RepID=A0A645GPK9_9ZZZZ